jgi:hypothetical protein
MAKKKINKIIKSERKKINIPAGVKVISVYYFAIFALEIISLIAIAIGNFTGKMNIYDLTGMSFWALAIPSLIVVLGFLIAGIYLFKLRTWAKYLAILLSIYTIGDIAINFNVLRIPALIITLIILSYLLFNKSIKEAFN